MESYHFPRADGERSLGVGRMEDMRVLTALGRLSAHNTESGAENALPSGGTGEGQLSLSHPQQDDPPLGFQGALPGPWMELHRGAGKREELKVWH